MGKATRIRQQNAREKIAAQRAAAQRAERRRRLFITGGSILAVVAIVVAFVVVKSLGSSAPAKPASATGTPLPSSVVNDITNVPASTLAAVGKGSTDPKSIIRLNGTPLTKDGKPEVLYIGAEYCPYCAAERWAMAVALSKFGTFTGLHGIHSSSSDVPPSIPTLTFYKTGYTSKYLVFTPVETTTEDRNTPLQKTTAAQQALLNKYDAPPYVSQGSTGAIPFVDFGNKFLVSGASYNPAVLQGKSWSEVAAALSDPASPISQGAVGAANSMTAAICKLTNNQPATACTPAIQRLEGQL
jgi:thiol-disulfide isomerase/thioredoxin